MILRLVEPPDTEPVTVGEVKAQSRVLGDHEDDLIQGKIQSWREQTETATQRALLTQTWELIADAFPDHREPIRLHRPPVASVDSVVYVDQSGAEQTLETSDYMLVPSEPGLLYPAPGQRWPATQKENPMAVKVRFVSGYGGDAGDVPESLRDAVIIGAATGYSHREDLISGEAVAELGVIDSLWDKFRWDPGVG